MAKVHAPLYAFNRGEVSRAALCRVDNERLRLASEAQVNWSPFTLGAMMLRPGLGYLFSTRGDAAAFPIPFVFGVGDTAILELTDSHLQVIVNDAKVTRASVSTSVTNGDFSSGTGWTLAAGSGTADINSSAAGALYLAAGGAGDVVSALRSVSVAGGDQNVAHALRITVTRGPVTFMAGSTSGGTEYIARQSLGTGTHSLVFTPTGGTVYIKFESALRYGVVVDGISVESSGTLDLPTPWVAADLSKIRYDQSGDIVFVAAAGYAQRKIERRDNNSWSVVLYLADDGPFKTQNFERSRTISASAAAGSISLTGINTAFAAADVGALLRLDETEFSLTANWKASESLTIPTEALPVSGTKIGDMTNLANAFDGNAATSATKTAASGYIGVNMATPSAVYSVSGTIPSGLAVAFNFNSTLYGKVGGAPASATDGTPLGMWNGTYFGVALSFGMSSSNTSTTWDYTWVAYTLSTSVALSISEITGLRFTAGGTPLLRRYNGNVYQAISGTTSGVNPPTHLSGDLLSETGGTVWRFIHGLFGVVRITAVASATSASADVLSTLPASIAARPTWSWAQGDWNSADGFPTEVRFFEGRLWWFRGDKRWASVSDDYSNFGSSVEGDAATINRTFGSGPVDRINFALDLTRLIIGREMSIDPVRSSSFEEPLTPTNNTAKSCATKGAAALPALKVGGRGVYVEKSGRKVYELVYQVQAGDYVGHDLTRLNLDIGAQGFVSLAVREQVETELHFVRGDGQDAILLHEPDEEIACWWRLMTLGVIERVVVLPASQEDSVYYVVKRTINGSTKRFWEKQAKRSECVGGTTCKLADAHLVISQASSTTISGLSHLEGEAVVVWGNGKDLGSYTVAAGAITVSEAVTSAIVGLGGVSFSYDSSTASATLTAAAKYNGYPAEVYASGAQGGKMRHVGALTVAAGVITLPNGKTAKKIVAYLGFIATHRSAKLAYGAQMGSALTQVKKVEKLGLVLHDTHYQGLQYGSAPDNLQPLPLTAGGQDIASDTVFDEHEEAMVGLSGDWNTDSRLHLLAQAPKPCTVAGLVVAVNTSESR